MPQEMFDLLIEEKIVGYLLDMKICPNIRGFRFILDGVKMIFGDIVKKKNINNVLYNDIASCYCVARMTVDGALRHAIDVAAKRSGFKNFVKDYDYIIKGDKPTPRELLSALAIKIKNDEHQKWI